MRSAEDARPRPASSDIREPLARAARDLSRDTPWRSKVNVTTITGMRLWTGAGEVRWQKRRYVW